MEKFKSGSVLSYHSLGSESSEDGLGVGFIDKSGISDDNINLRFPRYVLVIVIHGRGCYLDATGNRYPLEAGSCFQRLPNVPHGNLIDPESHWQEYYLEIGGRFFDLLRDMNIIKPDMIIGNIAIDRGLENSFKALINTFRSYRASQPHKLFGDFTTLLMECYRRMQADNIATPEQQIVDLACKLLASDFRQKFDLKKFCRQHGWGYENFRKIFKQQLGISPGRYRIRRRLDYSCELLKKSSMSIAEIAAQLGYSSQYEYSAQFKKHFGRAPKFFRN